MKGAALAAIFLALAITAPAVIGYPTLTTYVTDQSGVLLSDEIALIENVCDDIWLTTGCEMAVLIVPTTEPDAILIYGVETFELNALGQEGKDNGLLIIIATDDNEWRIEVGYGLQGILPASRVGNIGDTIIEPELAMGNYFTGVGGAVAEIAQIILDEYDYENVEVKDPYPIDWIPLTTWQLVLVIGVIIFIAIITKGQVFLWLIPFGKGGKKWGGGKSGGGGAGGKW